MTALRSRAWIPRRVRASPLLARIASNAGWLSGEVGLRLLVGLTVGVWLTRYMGPERFGLYNYAIAFASLIAPLAALGVDRIVVRDLVAEPRGANEILGSAFAIKLAGGVGATALTVLLIAAVRPNDAQARWLVAIIAGASIFKSLDAIDLWFQSEVRSKYAVAARSAAFAGSSLIKIALILGRAPVVAFAWALLAEAVFGAAGQLAAYRASGRSVASWKATAAAARRLLRDGWPLGLASAMLTIYMRIDQVMLGQMVGDREVGIYSAAVRLVEVWYFIPTAIVVSTFPSIVEARAQGEELFLGRLERLYRFLALVAYAVALPTTFLAGWVVVTLFGEPYRAAGPMLAVFIWSGVFTSLGVARGAFLTAMNWTKPYLFTVALGCVANVVLNFILIPRYGGMGAVIASCVAYWLAAHGSCFLYPPLIPTGRMLTRAMLRPGW
jgi:O-antigen/teichoic acid export membrane protein